MRLFRGTTSRGHFSPTEEFFCFVFGFFYAFDLDFKNSFD